VAAVASPFGLRPVSHPSGIARVTVIGTIATGYATNLFQNAPVAITADGSLIIAVAGTTNRLIGSFQGVEYVDATGKPVTANYWPASTAATNIVAYFTSDPAIIYEIQANGSVAQARVGEQISFAATPSSGSTGTGMSSAAADTATVGTAVDQLRILGISAAPDNVWGDAFTNVLVQISHHQNVADQIGY
jgi:hypothetical protein